MMKRNILLAVAALVLAVGFASTAQAQWVSRYGGLGYRSGVSVSIGVGRPGYVGYPGGFYRGGYAVGYGRPVYVAPRPVYIAPRPVYVAPRPVYVAPRRVYGGIYYRF